ncbi:MAG TPA: hypothetical protein VM934_13715 [Pyrinomonadaceae bacterium]|nr:hypothetical protein [Pyrinomonadaceae bacterium]
MKKNLLPILTLACLLMSAAPAILAQSSAKNETQEGAPLSRRVSGRTLISKESPAARITFDKNFKYVGGQSFVLYGVANAEQHFFVDADKQGRIKRLYWVQFEGYLPANTHTYNYKSPLITNVDGYDFFADAYPRNIPANRAHQRPDSDGSRAQAFLESKGLRMAGDDVIMQRLVHMTDKTNRSELMFIYIEDLSGTGLTAADLSEKGSAAARWQAMSKELLARAVKGIRISRQ